MIEVLTDITTESGGGKVSVMYFNQATPPLAARTAVFNFWDSVRSVIAVGTTFSVRAAGREVDEATGDLTGFWSSVGGPTISGIVNAQAVADATQGLVQWRTGVVLASREVRGRTFIPGIAASLIEDGNLSTSGVNSLASAAGNLLDVDDGFGVWRRPKEGAPGQHVQATNATAWREFAVLRRRRR